MYSIPIKISPEWENDITIFIGNKGQFSSIKLSIEGKAGTKIMVRKPKGYYWGNVIFSSLF